MDSIRPWLYVGRYWETVDRAVLRTHGIQAMLQLAEGVEQAGIASLFLPVEDAEPIPAPLLKRGVRFALNHKGRQERVLIACGAGINRSCAFAIAVLKEDEGLGLLDCFREVKSRRKEAMLHHAVWESLCRYYHEDVPWTALLDAASPGE